ncbi:hypothetical protein Dimus_031061 [Dionaea muscipula]
MMTIPMNPGRMGKRTELLRVRRRKRRRRRKKKPKLTVSEAAAGIDATDLAAFLVDISVPVDLRGDSIDAISGLFRSGIFWCWCRTISMG